MLEPSLNFVERAKKAHKIPGNTVSVLCAAGGRLVSERYDWIRASGISRVCGEAAKAAHPFLEANEHQ